MKLMLVLRAQNLVEARSKDRLLQECCIRIPLSLDEATSALDSRSELLVRQALQHLMQNRHCALGATFTFVNKCEYIVWARILANASSPSLDNTGFELSQDSSQTFNVQTGWSGQMWGRTGCTFDGSGSGSCTTADCGSGRVGCNSDGASPPATLAEFS